MVIIYSHDRTGFKKLAEEVGQNPRGVSPDAWNLSGNHQQVGKGEKGHPVSFIPGPGGAGESFKEGGKLWAC